MSSKPRSWSAELSVVGLRFRMKADARRAFADMVAKRGSIAGVRLLRESDNPKHDNAIRILMPKRLMGGMHIGYLPAVVADTLAPQMDTKRLSVKSAVLTEVSDDYEEATILVRFVDVPAKQQKRKPRAKS